MHERLTWLKVNNRLSANEFTYLHRIINTKTPKFLYIIFCANSYLTWEVNSRGITLPLPRTDSMRRTVLYRSIELWNSLPLEVKEIHRNTAFKKRLKMYLPTLPTILLILTEVLSWLVLFFHYLKKNIFLCISMYMCVYVSVCMFVYIRVCVYMYLHIHSLSIILYYTVRIILYMHYLLHTVILIVCSLDRRPADVLVFIGILLNKKNTQINPVKMEWPEAA